MGEDEGKQSNCAASKVAELEGRLTKLRSQLDAQSDCQRTRDLVAECLVDLGVNMRFMGRDAEGLEKCGEALQHNARYAPAYYNLGVGAAEAGRAPEALQFYEKAIDCNPCYVEALCNTGVVFKRLNQPEAAIGFLKRALRVAPHHEVVLANYAEAVNDLGTKRLGEGAVEEAVQLFQEAVMARYSYGMAYFNLGVVHGGRGMARQASYYYQLAVHFNPEHAEAWHNLGTVYQGVGDAEKAVQCFEKAHEKSGHGFVQTMNSLAMLYMQGGKMDDAISLLRQAVAKEPRYAEAWNNLGVVLRDEGVMAEAIECYDKCLAIVPESENAAQNKLLALNFSVSHSVQDIHAHHLRWGARILAQYGAAPPPGGHHRREPPNRPLRVGYVSPDFYLHSVSYFCHHLLRHHDPEKVEFHCFSNVARADSKTFAFKQLVPIQRWHHITGVDAASCCELIRRLQIDILVDLTGHTASCRLDIFARKPAPIQVSWIGYPNTTGLPTIDYRFSDPYADPAHVRAKDYAETLYRLPESFICYCPDTLEYYKIIGENPDGTPADSSSALDDKPESFQTPSALLDHGEYMPNYRGNLAAHVSAPPSVASGKVTLGTFNNMAKINPMVARAWGKILQELPQARILLKSKPFAEKRIRDQTKAMLAEGGCDVDRVELVGLVPFHYNHLQYYENLDIALDCFPYAGTTTSCEALWMGVPMVTLRGETHATNVGASLMTSIGYPELIGNDVDDYVRIAVELAKNPERMATYRSALRKKMALSPLCDGKRYLRHVEHAYEEMWDAYATGKPRVQGAPGFAWEPPRPAPEIYALKEDSGRAEGEIPA
eukprot:Hpha_TRINITY_DN15094_c0_g2::TRINITY_DN15094_c0_g2_i1::g.123709::m.123709